MREYDADTKINLISHDELEQAKFEVVDGQIVIRTISKGAYFADAMLTLKFWEMKGLSLTDVENMYNFDFVVTENCVPVISKGKLVINKRP